MTATDGDKDRPQNIVYFLTGQGIDPDNPANSKFDINRTSGEIYVLKVINATSLPSIFVFRKKRILSPFSTLLHPTCNGKKKKKKEEQILNDVYFRVIFA